MNARIYSLLLTLCPADLRREFGAEMTQVFLEDLEEQRRRFGVRGAVSVWRRSLKDLCGVVLREAIAERQFVVPLIVYGLQECFAGMLFLTHRVPLMSLRAFLSGSLTSLIPATVAFVAARVTCSGAPILLGLERR